MVRAEAMAAFSTTRKNSSARSLSRLTPKLLTLASARVSVAIKCLRSMKPECDYTAKRPRRERTRETDDGAGLLLLGSPVGVVGAIDKVHHKFGAVARKSSFGLESALKNILEEVVLFAGFEIHLKAAGVFGL